MGFSASFTVEKRALSLRAQSLATLAAILFAVYAHGRSGLSGFCAADRVVGNGAAEKEIESMDAFMDAKKLGFGLMRLPTLDPNDAKAIDKEHVKRMVDLFIEKGFTYFDTAWMYCACKSEEATKEVLVDRYLRESYTLATKLHSSYFDS